MLIEVRGPAAVTLVRGLSAGWQWIMMMTGEDSDFEAYDQCADSPSTTINYTLCRREELTLKRLDFGGWSEIAESSPELGNLLPAQRTQPAQRGSLSTNQCAAGDWVWLPEQPQAGAHALVAVVSRLQLARVQRTFKNGAVGVQLFDNEAFTFSGAEIRLPPPRTKLEAEQRLLALDTSLRPFWVGQRVRLLNHPLVPAHFCFNAEHYDKHVGRCGGLQAVFDAGGVTLPRAARGYGYAGWARHELQSQVEQLGRPREWYDGELRGSADGEPELAIILSVDLHARCKLHPAGDAHPVDLTWGTADVQCFLPFCME